jgi:hypothetical protein
MIGGRLFLALSIAYAAAALSACAPMVATRPARLEAAPVAAAPVVVVRDAVVFTLPTGYDRTLGAGSRWRLVGRLEQGDVYRPVDAPFSIVGRQVHEAYLVIAGSALQGFYLPGEANYSPLTVPVRLNLGEP